MVRLPETAPRNISLETHANPPKTNKTRRRQPPKRKAAASSGGSKRQSKLAKEHNISAEEEAEIKEAFGLFAEPMEGEKEGVIPIEDVRRAMMSVATFLLPAFGRHFTPGG